MLNEYDSERVSVSPRLGILAVLRIPLHSHPDMTHLWLFPIVTLTALASCASPGTSRHRPTVDALRTSLSFCATFDDGLDADLARGDGRLFAAPGYEQQSQAEPGVGGADVERAADVGRRGAALDFRTRNRRALFYQAKGNVPTNGGSLASTFAFWLKLDPDVDLEPGFCDPIQVTDKRYDNGAVWVDFTKDDNPRHFRLGVFGDAESWNPTGVMPSDNPVFRSRLVALEEHPFSREAWHQVTITVDTIEGFGRLYIDGEPMGTTSKIEESFTWDMERAAIRIGLSYVGLFDELLVFDRPLTPAEVKTLHRMAPADLL